MREMHNSIRSKKEALPVIADYVLLEPWRNTNSGNARWSFATKDGKTYFIKEFLSPVFPASEEISKEALAGKRAICYAYYSKKRELYKRIEQSATGNLVLISDFFLYNTKYYVTTEKIEEMNVSAENIARAPEGKKLLLLKILTFSLMKLHENGVVHADLKPNNILIKESETGNLVAKIIDFDGSYLEGDQPDSEEVQGDLVYLAPETCRYMFGEEVNLTTKVDVFAAGLLFHLYLTGTLPAFSKEYDYVYEALLDDASVSLAAGLKKGYADLIRSMIAVDPNERPDMKTVLATLTMLENSDRTPRTVPPRPTPPPVSHRDTNPSPVKKSSPWNRPTGF